ncbi:MAG TPA: hypothetical protein VFZ61_26910 [Polyangiales bacterium]
MLTPHLQRATRAVCAISVMALCTSCGDSDGNEKNRSTDNAERDTGADVSTPPETDADVAAGRDAESDATDAGPSADGGAAGGAGLDAFVPDAAVVSDAQSQAEDGSAPADAASLPDAAPDACTAGAPGCTAPDALAPFRLDCRNLPSNGVCQGGPREVVLAMQRYGLVAMLDPADGRFLGYFKREPDSYYTNRVEYELADQGPDQCIWTVSETDSALVQRWNTDGTLRDAPLATHYFPVAGSVSQLPLSKTSALAFTRDKIYVASKVSSAGYPEITRWNSDGSFDRVELDGSYDIESMLVLGDGSIVYADALAGKVARIPAGGGVHQLILSVSRPSQIAHAGAGQLLAADSTISGPVYSVAMASGVATTVAPFMGGSANKWGIFPLQNGKWLITSGDLSVSALDPTSSNPTGQHQKVFTERAPNDLAFRQLGRACLSEAFVASRAPKPANDTCVAPPDGPALFAENFEGSSDFTGSGAARHYNAFYDRAVTGVTSSIELTGGYLGTRGLRILGHGTSSGGSSRTGVYASLPSVRPRYVSYRVRAGVPDRTQALANFSLSNQAAQSLGTIAGVQVYNDYVEAFDSLASTAPTRAAGKWSLVELRNIDWSARSYDLYVDCKRIAEAIRVPPNRGDAVDLLDLDNFVLAPVVPSDQTVAWFDDILIK